MEILRSKSSDVIVVGGDLLHAKKGWVLINFEFSFL
jgi:hypothetical protein